MLVSKMGVIESHKADKPSITQERLQHRNVDCEEDSRDRKEFSRCSRNANLQPGNRIDTMDEQLMTGEMLLHSAYNDDKLLHRGVAVIMSRQGKRALIDRKAEDHGSSRFPSEER